MEESLHHEHGTAEHNAPFLKDKRNLSLDKYFTVLASGDYNSFSMRDIQKVFSIHGSKQIRGKKAQLLEELSKMELNDFSRSTLGKCIQPAPMTLTNVVKDLTLLKWQACPVVSIRSFSSTQYNPKSPTSNPKASVNPAGLKSGKKKKNKKIASPSNLMSQDQSGRFVSSGGDNSTDQKDNVALMIETSGTSSSTVPEVKPNSANKRKRKMNQKTLEYLSSQNMPNLSLELGLFA